MGNGKLIVKNLKCLMRIIRNDQWKAIPASQSHLSEPYAILPSSSLMSTLMFLKRERKSNTSNAILPITPSVPDGLSSLSCLIHGNDFSCPQVVGIRNGTGELAHFTTR